MSSSADERLRSIESQAKHLLVSHVLGKTIGPYHVRREVGQDDTGAFFEATDKEHDRPVRFKVLWSKIANDEAAFARFYRAMRTTVDLEHPNIVRLYGAGKVGEYCFMAMEQLDARTLRELVGNSEQGWLCWHDVQAIGRDIARALECTRAQKILHRNIKPTNVLVTSDGTAKLDNLILAKATEGIKAESITEMHPNEIVGDIVWNSPESNVGTGQIDYRADIYSLGATLYYALAGRPPFEDVSIMKLAIKIQNAEPVSPREFQPDVPDDLERIVLKMLAKDPADRYAEPAVLRAELEGRFE